eukprot:scaffold1508_cov66-Phaeocystis_antarctica.AAC.2
MSRTQLAQHVERLCIWHSCPGGARPPCVSALELAANAPRGTPRSSAAPPSAARREPRSSGLSAVRGPARRPRPPLRRAAAIGATTARRAPPRTPPLLERGRSVPGTGAEPGSTWPGAEAARIPRARAAARRRPRLG